MAPKPKTPKVEESEEKPPEGDDERVLTITLSGVLLSRRPGSASSPIIAANNINNASQPPINFTPLLNSPFFTLVVPYPNSEPLILKSEPIQARTVDGDFSVDLWKKKLLIQPSIVNTLLSQALTLGVMCVPEQVRPPSSNPAKGAKAPMSSKPSTKSGKDVPVDLTKEATTLLRYEFDLANVLVGRAVDYIDLAAPPEEEHSSEFVPPSSLLPGLTKTQSRKAASTVKPILGFRQLMLTITCSGPLLSPQNVLRYLPVIVEVCKAENCPSLETLSLNHTMNPRIDEIANATVHHKKASTLKHTFDVETYAANGGTVFDGVAIQYQFMDQEIVTNRFAHARSISFHHRRVFFLYQYPKISVIEFLFFKGLTLELHDRDRKGQTKKSACGYGFVGYPLRLACDGGQRFIVNGQLVPRRNQGDGFAHLADYVSNATMVSAKVQFLAKLPLQQYLVSSGVAIPAPFRAMFLSRVLLVVPHRMEGIKDFLRGVMGTIVRQKRASKASAVFEMASPHAVPSQPPPTAEGKNVGTAKGKLKEVVDPTAVPVEALPLVFDSLQFVVPDGVSGFELMDGETRIICVEGYIHTIHEIVEVAAHLSQGNKSVKIFVNMDLAFPQRWYHNWPPLVQPIKLPVVEEPKPIPVPASAVVGKKSAAASAIPGKKKTDSGVSAPVPVVERPSVDVSPVIGGGEAQDTDLDAGGVGGRIRRIRLDQTIGALCDEQRNFLKLSLSLSTLRCISKLSHLRQTSSMIAALDHDFFPTAEELISLERVHGKMLEIFDVCGCDTFVNFSDTNVEEVVRTAQETSRLNALKQSTHGSHEIDVTNLKLEAVGQVLSFIAIPANPDQLRQLPAASKIFPRYSNKYYMSVVECEGRCVLCAFSIPPPKQALRYHVSAQVVKSTRSDITTNNDQGESVESPILFVLNFEPVSKKYSDNHNPEFDAKLRRDLHKAKASEYFTILRKKRRYYLDTHNAARGDGGESEGSDIDEGHEFDQPPKLPQDNSEDVMKLQVQPNYVALNKKSTTTTRTTASEQPSSDSLSYDHCRALYQQRGEQRDRLEAQMSAVVPAKHATLFATVNVKLGAEARHHPKTLSEARSEDLKQPWVAPTSDTGTREKGPTLFRFNGSSDVWLLNDVTKDTSGSLTAAATANEEADRQRQERELWKSKVVVDDTTFVVSSRTAKDKAACQLDKLSTMLHGPPLKKAIQQTYCPSFPMSIRELERLVPNERIDPLISKHPDCKQFYYPNLLRDAKKAAPILDVEKQSPLFYEFAKFK